MNNNKLAAKLAAGPKQTADGAVGAHLALRTTGNQQMHGSCLPGPWLLNFFFFLLFNFFFLFFFSPSLCFLLAPPRR